jgi:hypothetical protein
MHGNVVLNFTPYAKGDLDVYGLAYREAECQTLSDSTFTMLGTTL